MIDIIAELRADNPFASAVELEVFGNALRIYMEASVNVGRNGAVCAHPRTGAPIENPYLKVQVQQAALMAKYKRIKANRVMELLRQAAMEGR